MQIVNYHKLYKMSQKPSLIVFSGPMFAGKSTNLIDAYTSSHVPAESKLIFKYAKDTRYSDNAEIVTHNKVKVPCIMITKCTDITEYINNSQAFITEIYIDECQFLSDIYTWTVDAKTSIPSLITIVMAGLDLDATGKPFTEAFKNVIDMADVNCALAAKCYICSEHAQYTKLLKSDNLNKMSTNSTNILIGGAELYQPVCGTHFHSL